MSQRRAVTTSWDDGHPDDLRLAALLASFDVKATFYVPIRNAKRPVLSDSGIRELRQLGMEVGAHTVNHTELPGLSEASLRSELRDSRIALEDILEESVTAFCYPRGKFRRSMRTALIEAGYKLGRTTESFALDARFDPLFMPVTYQFYPHRRRPHLTHALKERNLRGLRNWIYPLLTATDLGTLGGRTVSHLQAHGGLFHLWGHSWELTQAGLWGELREMLTVVRDSGISSYTNSQAVAVMDQG